MKKQKLLLLMLLYLFSSIQLKSQSPVSKTELANSVESYTGCATSVCTNTCEVLCNGDFEQYGGSEGGIPQGASEIEKACGWKSGNTATPDYFHSLSPTNVAFPVNIPTNFAGCEPERTGKNGYAGFFTAASANYYEAMFHHLNTTLVQGKTYNISFYLSLSEGSTNNTTNSVAFAFATNYAAPTPTTYNTFGSYNASSYRVINTNNVTKNGWTFFTFTYTAQGGENDFIIGGLPLNSNPTLSVPLGSQTCPNNANMWPHNYYYIDDVSIKEASQFTVTPVNSTICQGPITLSITPSNAGTNFTWTSVPATPSLSTQNGLSITVNPTVNTTYAASLGSCVNTASAGVSVINYSLNVTSNTPNYCVGANPVTLTASGGGFTTYTWSPHPSIISTNLNSPQINVAPSAPTTYTVYGSVAGCPKTYSATVAVTMSGVNFAISSNSICASSTVAITTATSVNISAIDFGDPNFTGSNYPNPYSYSTAGNYTVFVEGTDNITGCYSYSLFPVTVIGSSSITVGPSSNVCPVMGSATLTASGANSYTWQPGYLSGSTVVVHPNTTTTYTVSGTSSGCPTPIIATVTVKVNELPLVVSTTNTTTCDGKVTLTASGYGLVNYNWQPINVTGTPSVVVTPTAPTIYTVTAQNILGCTETATIQIIGYPDACGCFTCNPLGATGTISTSPVTNDRYCINNNVTINGTVSFANIEVKIAAGVSIVVAPGAILIINHAHLFSRTALWSGITVQNGGRLSIVNNSLIEDASAAVSINGHTGTSNVLNINSSIFNKNSVGVYIQNYNQNVATAPFAINNSLFTSRLIYKCTSFLGWPTTANVKAATNSTTSPLQSPYIDNATYPVTTLLGSTTAKPSFAIRLTNVGTSSVSTSSATYNEMVVGTASGTNTYNVFDNHGWSILMNNSNLTVNNSVFQNGHENLGYSRGIWAISNYPNNNRLRVNSAGAYSNKFYDVKRGVKADNYYEVDFSNCEVYSSRVYNPAAAIANGTYGFSGLSNRYNNITLNSNKIYNIDNGITFNATVGSYSVGTATGNGQYIGSITTNSNIIRSHLYGYTPNPNVQYGFKAITLSSVLGAAATTTSNQIVYSNNNEINDYENGISCSNWPFHHVVSMNNSINVRNSVSAYQYGIEHNDNTCLDSYADGILQNNVTANSISANPNNYAIRSSQNKTSAVRCNTVSNTYNGIAYSATTLPGSLFRNNIFVGNNHYGFVLENSAVIGQQGAILPYPQIPNNRWQGNSWVLPNYKTATINSTAQDSKMYVFLGQPDTDPDGSGYTSNLVDYNVKDYFYNGNIGTLLHAIKPGVDCNYIPKNLDSIYLLNQTDLLLAINLLEQIALTQAPSGIEHAMARFVAKSELFNFLTTNPGFLNKSGILNGFYNSNKHKYRELFMEIEENIALGNVNQAQNDLTAYIPQNNSETKHKQFFTLLLKHQTQTLDATDEQQLLNLATGCPATDGAFIHKARTLYNVAFDKNNNFKDSCDYTNNNNARNGNFMEENTDTETFGAEVMLYPNPNTTGEMFIFVNDENVGVIDIQISTANGLVIKQQNLNLVNSTAKLNLKVANGIYFVTIINPQTKQRVVKKLVIQN